MERKKRDPKRNRQGTATSREELSGCENENVASVQEARSVPPVYINEFLFILNLKFDIFLKHFKNNKNPCRLEDLKILKN